MGRLETAVAVLDCAGECPFDVSEKFAFQQTLGEGAAVDADVVAVGAGAELVDGAGDEFLAGPRFADEEDAGAGRRRQRVSR